MTHNHSNPHLELPPPGPPQRIQSGSHTPQQQPQQYIASMYPKIPIQDQPPTYSPYPSPMQPTYNQVHPQFQQGQPQYQEIQQAQPPSYQSYPVFQQQQQPYPQQPMQMPRPAFYGSVAPPSVASPALNGNQTVQSVETLGTESRTVQCPHCQQIVNTVLDYDAGSCTIVSIGGLYLVGCHSGLCLLPYFFRSSKDVTHECPSCAQKIATYRRLERSTRVLGPPPDL